MKFIIIILSIFFLFTTCEESDSGIIENPNATATFWECIPFSFSSSRSVRIDTVLVEKIQEALRLARTVDIDLQEFSGELGCGPRYDFQIFFSQPLDSTLIADSCRTGFELVDSLLNEYGFQECDLFIETLWIENAYGYVFYAPEYLNLYALGTEMRELESVVEAGIPPVTCDVFQCKRTFFSRSDDVFTFKFQNLCQNDEVIEWIVVVANNEAFLVSKN